MKLKCVFLSCVTAMTAVATAAATFGLVTETVSQKAFASASGVNVPYRSQEDIRNYIGAHSFSTSGAVSFSEQPDMTSPYESSGALDSSTLTNGLNAMNVMRYIAGLSEVTLNSDYNALCQDGAYVNSLNGTISHSPQRPNGISDSIYESGKNACGSSNLAMGYGNLANAVLGYMDDSDSSNIDRLGHRRWILNPSMEQTGMGQVNRCSALYAFDNSFGKTSINGVCWPAQTMPTEYFDGSQAWSWSSGEKIADPNSVSVTLTRSSDGKTWNFSSSSADGFFNVENSNYGKPGCVIFRPDNLTVNAGDLFTVNIMGTGKTVNYTVDFFALDPPKPPAAVTGLNASKNTPSSVTLSWNRSSTADSYEIDMYKNGQWVYVTQTTGTSYTVDGLSANTSYDFKVFSFKDGQYGNSAALTAKTAAAPQSSSKPVSSSSKPVSSSSKPVSSSSSAVSSSSKPVSSSSNTASSSSSTASSSSKPVLSSSSTVSSSSKPVSSSSSTVSSSSSAASSSSSTASSSSSAQTAIITSGGESSQAAADNNGSFPIVPVAVGGGVVAAGGIGALVAHLIKIRKN